MNFKNHVNNVKVMEAALTNFKQSIKNLFIEVYSEAKTLEDKAQYDVDICRSEIEMTNDLMHEYETLFANVSGLIRSLDYAKITIEALYKAKQTLHKAAMKKEGK